MRTASIDAVLGPVAEAISDFLLANEDAEMHGIPLGDLYPTAQAISASVQGLVSTAASVLEAANDEYLRRSMPAATQEVQQACDLLLKATLALRQDPLSILDRQHMIAGAKGILTGTRRVLEVFDDYEVSKVVKACKDAEAHVQNLRKVTGIETLVPVMQPAAQALVTAAQLADRRINDLLDPWLKVQLAQAKDVVRGSSTLLVASMKAFVMHPDEPSRTAKDLNLDRLSQGLADISRIVQMPAPPLEEEYRVGKLAAARARVTDALMAVHAAVVSGDRAQVDRALAQYNPLVDEILRNAQEALGRITDPAKKKEIEEAYARVQALKGKLEAAARYAMEHPEDLAAQQALVDLMRELDSETLRLERLVADAMLDEITRTVANLGDTKTEGTTVHQLLAAARAGDVAATERLTAALSNEAKALRAAAMYVASATDDPAKARAIEDALRHLDTLQPQLVAAARMVALNPNDPAAKEYLAAIVSEWEAGVTNLKNAVAAAQRPEDMIAAAAKAVIHDLDRFQDACRRQDAEALKVASAAVSQKVFAVAQLANAEIENSSDPAYQAKLRAQVAEMQATMPELQAKAKAVFLNPNDPTANAELKAASGKVVASMKAIQATIAEHTAQPVDPRWKDIEAQVASLSLGDDVVVVEGEAPQELTAEEAAANPIKASAMSLKVEASKWSADGNRMIAASEKLAEKMAKLAEYAANVGNGSKKDLINMAKEIAAEVKAIEEEARRIASSCSDKRLAKDLMATADRIPTIATQLKILATVKAANPDDNDNDQMLVQCATNLMESVKSTIKSSQAAEIRSVRAAANVAVAAIRWKRKIYKNNGGASAQPKSLASLMTGKTTIPAALKKN